MFVRRTAPAPHARQLLAVLFVLAALAGGRASAHSAPPGSHTIPRPPGSTGPTQSLMPPAAPPGVRAPVAPPIPMVLAPPNAQPAALPPPAAPPAPSTATANPAVPMVPA